MAKQIKNKVLNGDEAMYSANSYVKNTKITKKA